MKMIKELLKFSQALGLLHVIFILKHHGKFLLGVFDGGPFVGRQPAAKRVDGVPGGITQVFSRLLIVRARPIRRGRGLLSIAACALGRTPLAAVEKKAGQKKPSRGQDSGLRH